MGWVRLHPYNIAQKVQVVVEHFRQYIAPLFGLRVVIGLRVVKLGFWFSPPSGVALSSGFAVSCSP